MINENDYKRASNLIFLSIILGIPTAFLSYKYDYILLSSSVFVMLGVGWSLTGCLAYNISKGKVWAIWIFTVLAILGSYNAYAQVSNAFEKNILYGLTSLCQNGLQFFSLYLIHKINIQSLFRFKNKHVKLSLQANVDHTIAARNSNTPYDLNDIGKLHDLYKTGAITQDEFEQQKKKILEKAA